MREAVRQQYLQAMGIPVWVPRHELPNAAPSNLLPVLGEGAFLHGNGDVPSDHLPDYRQAGDHHRGAHMAAQLLDHGQQNRVASPARPAEPTPASSEHAPVPAVAAETSQAAAVVSQSAAGESTAVQPAAKPAASAEVQAALTPADLTAPRFELHFVKFGDAVVWVCDDYNELSNLLALAPRVCAAMGWEVLRSEPVMFRWPFIENAREDQSAAVAEQALRAQWNYFAHHGGKLAIGLGANTRKWLQRIEVPGAFMDQPVSEVMQGEHSGALKKQLWLQLLEVRELANDA